MELEYLKILSKPFNGGSWSERLTAKFNPNQVTIQKSASVVQNPRRQSNTPNSNFNHGNAARLTMDLFFDTYEDGEDVRDYTQKLYDLVNVEGSEHRSPLCKLVWGKELFQGILQSLNQRFTLFLPSGLPVRATVGCTFQEWKSTDEDQKETDNQSSDVAKIRIVKRGDTLSSIAGEEYRDSTLWRPIAEENAIDDPTLLTPGVPLTIPIIKTRS
jgi:nucleoid-associated protein YgaU